MSSFLFNIAYKKVLCICHMDRTVADFLFLYHVVYGVHELNKCHFESINIYFDLNITIEIIMFILHLALI